MQVKCQRCDKLFSPVSTEKYCQDCIAGKPVVRYTPPPKKEDGSICIVCGKRFYPKNKLRKTCSWDCAEERRKEQNKEWRINNKKISNLDKKYYQEYMSAIKFFKEMRELNETNR